MPLNRNQFARLRVIHNLIATHTKPNWQRMAEACIAQLPELNGQRPEAIKRTIFNDLENLRNAPFFAPLHSQKGKYSYEWPYSLNEVLNPDELALLHDIQTMFRQYATLPQFKGFEAIQLAIEQRVGRIAKDEIIIEFEENRDYQGMNHLMPLYEAIKHKQAISLIYRDFVGQIHQHTLSPYLLKEYNNRWYVVGWQHHEQQLYNLALDRIQKIEPSLFQFLDNKANATNYFRDIVGVTRLNNQQPESIQIKVLKPRAYYLKTKPLHHSQVIENQTESFIIFGYWLIPNQELESELLSLGADAEVLAPASLQNKIQKRIQAMNTVYENRWIY